jgi:hypothetical protein
MPRKTKRAGWARGVLLTAVLASLPLPTLPAQGEGTSSIAVVVNPDTPVSNLSLEEVRRIFLGERQYWTAKLPVVLLVRAPVARERDTLLQVVYQMNEAQFKRYWIAKIFRAEAATAPKIVYSNDLANELTATMPGAIAFMDARDVRPGVKVIRIDGYLPGEAGYPLH